MAGFNKTLYVPLCLLAIALLWGCATTSPRPDPAVENARRSYAAAAALPNVNEYAPVPLREASLNLRRAEQAESASAREHFAYLAERQAQLAMAMSEKRRAENEMARLADLQDTLVLQSHRQTAQEAEMEAERLRRDRELARERVGQTEREAEILRRQAEMTQMRLERQSRETQKLRQELAEFKASETDRGLVLTLESFLFETDSSTLKPGAYRGLEKLSGYLKQNPDANIVIEGHTDNTGSAEYNLDLSRQRADAVARALRSQGVQSNRIETRGHGEGYPVASNDTQAGRLQNRRVEIVIEGEPETRAGGGRRR